MKCLEVVVCEFGDFGWIQEKKELPDCGWATRMSCVSAPIASRISLYRKSMSLLNPSSRTNPSNEYSSKVEVITSPRTRRSSSKKPSASHTKRGTIFKQLDGSLQPLRSSSIQPLSISWRPSIKRRFAWFLYKEDGLWAKPANLQPAGTDMSKFRFEQFCYVVPI